MSKLRHSKSIVEANLLCKTNRKLSCDYYGNPKWEGFCSKCWRDHVRQMESKTYGSSTDNSVIGGSSGIGFNKFQEKKKKQSDRKSSTLRSVFMKSPSTDNHTTTWPKNLNHQEATTSYRSNSSHGGSQQHQQDENSSNELDRILSPLTRSQTHEVRRQLKHLEKILYTQQLTVEQSTNIVQDIYNYFEDKLQQSASVIDENDIQKSMCTLEDIIVRRLYIQLFSPPEDEASSVALQSRIRKMTWVTDGGFLEHKLLSHKPEVNAHTHECITHLIELATVKSIDDKLELIMKFSKTLMQALILSGDRPPSADDFLPAVIFLILASNPPLLKSNISFISNYAAPSRLLTGEKAYYFTNLSCAVSFIEKVSANDLEITESDFDAYMAGDKVPQCVDESAMILRNPVLEGLQRALDMYTKLEDRNETFLNDCDVFKLKMETETKELVDRVRAIRARYPPIAPDHVVIDADISPGKEAVLPPPILPTRDGSL